MDDILCDNICRSSLCAEEYGDRCGRLFAGFDLKIFVDHIQCIHLLSLVLMETLNLDIEDRILIEIKALCLL